jgi:hypothetical protein
MINGDNMEDSEMIIKIIEMMEKIDGKIGDNNKLIIERIELKINTIEQKLDNCVTKEECSQKSKENIGIRKITALGLMFGAIGTATIGILTKLKNLIESLFK